MRAKLAGYAGEGAGIRESCYLVVRDESDPGNHHDMFLPDEEGRKRNWILEIHFVDKERQIGGFFEQLLT